MRAAQGGAALTLALAPTGIPLVWCRFRKLRAARHILFSNLSVANARSGHATPNTGRPSMGSHTALVQYCTKTFSYQCASTSAQARLYP